MNPMMLAFVAVLATGAAHAAEKSCFAEIGRERATELVDQCVNISPATHPPCNAENPCALIRSEIQRGCDMARSMPDSGQVPNYCEQYPSASEQPNGY